jgi:hypothetical protein
MPISRAGYQQHRFADPDPINLRAVAIMDDLHAALKAGGYDGHELEQFLVASSSVCLHSVPASSSARRSGCTSRTGQSRTDRTWGFT